MECKIFKFDHSEGAEIVASKSAAVAINFYFEKYLDDEQIGDMVEFGGVEIEMLEGDNITKVHEILNEETGQVEKVSYKELAEKFYKGNPEILVMPHY
jgi:hypothetical protein